jgi:hypothetical protein
MKKFVLAGSVLVMGSIGAFAADLPVKAPVASPVLPQANGDVEVYSGGSWLDNANEANPAIFSTGTTSRYDGWPIGGAGRGNWWATKNFSIQMDAQAEGTQYTVPREVIFDPIPGTSHDPASRHIDRDTTNNEPWMVALMIAGDTSPIGGHC